MIHYHVADRICTLRLDEPPLNTITLGMLDELQDAVARANQDPLVGGIVLTGTADHFSAGADIHLFEQIQSATDARTLCETFQNAFQRIEESAKPVVAAVAGRVMGGALELAMSCHLRVCTRDTRLSMPEVNLGINPGAGGTQRLPRLVTVEAALQMLLSGSPIDAQTALEWGLVDAVCDRGDRLLPTAGGLLSQNISPRRTLERTDKRETAAEDAAALDRAVARLAGSRPEIIAPGKIVEAVRASLDRSAAEGMAKEREVFGECIETPAARNKIYLFFASRKTAKLPAGEKSAKGRVQRAAVVGLGTMGVGIVQALMQAGVPATVYDDDPAAVDRAIARIGESLDKRVSQGRLSRAEADRLLETLAPARRWRDLHAADLVIEAVYEDLSVKQDVLDAIERECREGAIVATNTSTISLDELAGRMRHPERLIGLHFFNPAHRMPLVEVIHRAATSAAVRTTAFAFAKRLRKTPVLVRSSAGFLVSRLFVPYVNEAFWLLEEGADPHAVDAAATEFGFPMGPLTLIDMAGLDILVATDRVLRDTFPRHGPISTVVTQLVAAGHLGQKAGSGVYKYQLGDHTPGHSDFADEIITAVRRHSPRQVDALPAGEIARRLVMRMVAEAGYVLQEDLVARESDIDTATVLGIGFPDFRGGVLKYARDRGADRVRRELECLAAECGERFRPCPDSF